ncbi:bifunctional metallophosphatase/5'-nucleotidase [Brevibacillus humidisoli]|uniref:bifunctional metallophosphatase/5'-nucleotidase n=1 Tax=Brevibacillus humidisoli TaxID=2895522 RepID=UPI001E2AE901|nr:bifunctional UDP-sugar hydrolase/5'-nucleotidase [Brevibacillus humidisoli]UFJ39711.1 bifunctional metallophosphatase/5'-nucleotidase [Brevibacillus humidisoli]
MSRTCTLHILHTNDIHSHFEHMAQICSCLKEKRAQWEQQGGHVLTVDIGDHADRSRMKTEATWGHANVEVLNHSGYQYVTIGNNEGLTFPKEQLDGLYQHAAFTVVVSNLIDGTSEQLPAWASPYVIHEWDGFRVALLGVTAAFGTFYRLLGWEVMDPLPLIKRQVRELRPQVDAIIVLSHLGYGADKQMAAELEGIDVILGGHTHHLLEHGEQVGSVLIAQAGKFGDYVGHVQLLLDQEEHRVLTKEASVLNVGDAAADPAMEQLIEREKQAAEQVLSQPIATLSREMTVDWMRETPFASLMAASLRRWTGAEIGMANSGLLLTPLKQGEVTRKDLLQCVPHPVKPCAITLTGEQLLAILQRAVQTATICTPLKGFGFRGKMLGWMAVDGMTVYYTDGAERTITHVEVAGQPLAPLQQYRVGTVDMFMFNHLFPEFHRGKEQQFFLPEVLREVMAEMIADEDLITASLTPRWIRS